jgi:hypothetical protein
MTPDRQKHDPRIYQITFKGQLDEDFLAAYCPPGFTLQNQEGFSKLSNVCTDQAGLIGLIRHLHNLGCTLIAVNVQETA